MSEEKQIATASGESCAVPAKKTYLVAVNAFVERSFRATGNSAEEALGMVKLYGYSDHTDVLYYFWNRATVAEATKTE